MATSKFKEDKSAFQRNLHKSGHHESDFKYQEYSENTHSKTASEGASSNRSLVVFALFGLGRAGSIHFGNIMANPRARLRYVVEQDAAKCEWFKQKWNLGEGGGRSDIIFLQDDSSAVFADPLVDAVLVATPTFTHEGIILSALKAGKAVFSEKPVAQSIEDTKRCYEEAARADQPLFCAFNRRFDPSMEGVRVQVRKGAVGHVQLIRTTSRDSPLPSLEYLKISGGIFHDCAVHDIDMVTWVLGEYPNRVYAAANAQIDEIRAIGDHDNVVITMNFPSGTLACIDLSRLAVYGYDQRLEVFGPRGMLKVENDRPNTVVAATDSSFESCPIYHSFPSRHAVGYCRELNHFLDVVCSRKNKTGNASVQLSVCGKATAATSKIADACEKSVKTGNPVELDWVQDELPEGVCFDKT